MSASIQSVEPARLLLLPPSEVTSQPEIQPVPPCRAHSLDPDCSALTMDYSSITQRSCAVTTDPSRRLASKARD